MRKRSQAEQLSLFLTPDQASRISGLGVNRIRRLMEYLPVGNRKLTTIEALQDYYQRAKIAAT